MKPTSEHKRQGTFRDDRHGNRLDAAVKPGVPAKPDDLPAESAQLWDTVLKHLPEGTASELDAAALEMCCRWFAEWKRCQRELESGEQSDGYKWSIRAATASKQFSLLAGRFGLTPGDRTKLKVEPDKPKGETPWERLAKMCAKKPDHQ